MGDLTKNLSRHEFACKCGCGLDTVDIETLQVIQDVCNEFETKVTINSGCRCPEHNSMVGGADHSQHLYCRAADCSFWGVQPADIYAYLTTKYPNRFGFGLYNTFVHVDTRTNGPARWNGT